MENFVNTFDTFDISSLKYVMLFSHLSEKEIAKVFSCLNAREVSYHKDAILPMGEKDAPFFGIVLEGAIFITSMDSDGSRSILSSSRKNDIFGLTMILDGFGDNLVVMAAEDCRVLFIDANKLFWGCSASCGSHKRLLYNMLTVLSHSNMELLRKFRHASQPTLRRKITSFLCEQQTIHGSDAFDIEYNRQELAEYLGADRSALSAELSRMKREGLIDYRKNHFKILECLGGC